MEGVTSFSGPEVTLNQCSLQSVISEPLTEAVEVDYPMKDSDHCSVSLVGSCDGLLCITIDHKDIFIWNPAIGKFKEVPYPVVPYKSRFNCLYGFGYDELNDDYKVVGVMGFDIFSNSNSCESMVMVYSLRCDSWKTIGGLKGRVLSNDAGKYVKGKIHWQVGPPYSGWEIVSLDLATEAYGKIDHPNYGGIKSDLKLGVVSGYLCVLSQYCRRGDLMDLWVMREYGVNESWTKILINPFLTDRWTEIYVSPMCIAENGEVLLVFHKEFVVYNPKNKALRYPEISNFDDIDETRIYVESLVSPVANSEAGREEQIKKAMS